MNDVHQTLKALRSLISAAECGDCETPTNTRLACQRAVDLIEAQDKNKIAGGDRYIIGRHNEYSGEKVGEIHTVCRYRPDPNASAITAAVLEWIGRCNGNGADAAQQWLEAGNVVHTNFATYKLEVRP